MRREDEELLLKDIRLDVDDEEDWEDDEEGWEEEEEWEDEEEEFEL